MSLVFTILDPWYLAKTLYNFIFKATKEDIWYKVSHWDRFVDFRAVMFKQICKTSKCIKFYIWPNSAIFLSDWRLDFIVNQFNDSCNMRGEIFFGCPHWETSKRNIALTSILTFCLLNIIRNIFDCLGEPIRVFVVIGNVTVHRRNQIDAFFLHQDFCWFF